MYIGRITRTAAAVGGALLLGTASASAADRTDETARKKPASAAMKMKAGELAAHPDRYMGKNVTVSADVERVYGSRMFTLDEDRIGAAPDVLVLVPDHASVQPGNQVTASGVVREFVWTDLRRDYEWFDLRPQFEVTFRSRPVLVATSVKGADESELVGRAEQPTIEQMNRQPGDYYGDFVSVRAPIGEIESPHVFTLDRGAGRPEILVLIPDPRSSDPKSGPTLSEKAQVTVKGVVRPFYMADLERDYDWFRVDPNLVVKLEDRPVIVAESVRNSAGQEFVGDSEARKPSGEPTAKR